MTDDKKVGEQAPRFDFSRFHLLGVEHKLKAGGYVEPHELAQALRNNGSHPISPEVLDYVCRLIEGDVKPPKGRRAGPALWLQQRDMVVSERYKHYLEAFRRLQRRQGRKTVWKGHARTPAELAARKVAAWMLDGEESWPTVQNIASSQK